MRGSPRCEAGSVSRRERESLRSYLEVSKAIRQVDLENRRQMRPKVGLASTWHGKADAHFARVVPSILRPLLILSAHGDISIPNERQPWIVENDGFLKAHECCRPSHETYAP